MSIRVEESGLIPYRIAHKRQMQLLEELHLSRSEEDTCLILEHPAVFTLGRNALPKHITVSKAFLDTKGIELLQVERGGEVTYHGPGQLICYPIINLRRKRRSVVDFIHALEQIMLTVAQDFGIQADRDSRNHGIWYGNRKLGSVGIAIRHGISYHGLALNVNPDLRPFDWINPCGMTGVSMTSMEQELQKTVPMEEVRDVMRKTIIQTFGSGAGN